MSLTTTETEERLAHEVATLKEALAAALKETRCGWETAKATDKELRKMVEQRNALHAELTSVKAERNMLKEAIAGETHLDGLTGEYARQATGAAEKANAAAVLFRNQRDYLTGRIVELAHCANEMQAATPKGHEQSR